MHANQVSLFVRHLVLLCCVLSAVAGHAEPSVSGPLRDLRPGHPRLLADASRFEELRLRRATDAELDADLTHIEQQAEALLDVAPVQRQMTGRRLLGVSREALSRVTTLAMAFRMSDDSRYLDRAERELLAVCQFKDWNPKHFLDVAEMAAAVALGYDWLYDDLSPETRDVVRRALVAQALDHVNKELSWRKSHNNWNSVCFGGITLAALAIAEDHPGRATTLLRAVQADNPNALAVYEPDGVYPEGPSYWTYGTTYQVILVEALRSALGTDLGLMTPAVVSSGRFVAHAIGPTGQAYNFSDGKTLFRPGLATRWIAREAGSPEWAAYALGSSGKSRRLPGRFNAISPLFDLPEPSPNATLPLSWFGEGPQPVAMFRSSWSDPDAMYLAVKGGTGSLSHAHLDAGSFMFEASGVRWALDPGSIGYNRFEQKGLRIFDRQPRGDRWKIYRHTNLAHNTVSVDDRLFRVKAASKITHFHRLEQGRGKAVIDLAPVIDTAETAERRFLFVSEERSVEVRDRMTGLPPGVTTCWTLVTQAEVDIRRDEVVLRQAGESLRVVAQSRSGDGSWSVEPFAPPPGYHDESEPDWQVLRWRSPASDVGVFDLTVTLHVPW